MCVASTEYGNAKPAFLKWYGLPYNLLPKILKWIIAKISTDSRPLIKWLIVFNRFQLFSSISNNFQPFSNCFQRLSTVFKCFQPFSTILKYFQQFLTFSTMLPVFNRFQLLWKVAQEIFKVWQLSILTQPPLQFYIEITKKNGCFSSVLRIFGKQ